MRSKYVTAGYLDQHAVLREGQTVMFCVQLFDGPSKLKAR